MAAMYYITFILSRRLPPKHYKTSSGGARIEPKSGPCSEQLLRVESRVLEDRAAATYRWERADPDSSIFSSQQQGAGQGDLQSSRALLAVGSFRFADASVQEVCTGVHG